MGGPPAAASTMSAPRICGQLGFRKRVAQVAQEDDVQALGAEMDDRHFVFGQTLGRLENVDRLEPDAAKDRALRGSSRARMVSNGGTIWPRWL